MATRRCCNETAAVLVVVLLLSQGLDARAGVPWRYDGDPRHLLSTMQQHGARLVTLQCTVEYDDFQTYEGQQKALESMRQAGLPGGLPPEAMQNPAKPGKPRHTYQTQKIVHHRDGRIRVELTRGICDDSGRKIPLPERSIDLWDGRTSIAYAERPGIAPPGAIRGNTRSNLFDVLRSPLRSFGGQFLDAFSTAVANGAKIGVEEIRADGTLRITFPEGDVKNVALVDPAKGFSVVHFERSRDNTIFVRFKAEFAAYGDGVWFPRKGVIEGLLPDGKPDMTSRVAVTQVDINSPHFSDNLFRLELPQGTQVAGDR